MNAHDSNSLLYEAVRLQQSNRFGEAATLCRQIIEEDSDCVGALHLLGVILHRLGQSDEGERCIRRAIALVPTEADFHINLGKLLRDTGRNSQAAEAFQQAVELRPNSAPAHFNLGQTLSRQNEIEEAIEALRRCAELDPAYDAAWLSLGNAHRKLGQLEDAEACYARVPESSGLCAVAWASRGNMLLRLGRGPQAEIVLEQSLKQRYSHKAAASLLAWYARCRNFAAAEPIAATALAQIESRAGAQAEKGDAAARVLIAIGTLAFLQNELSRYREMIDRAESISPLNVDLKVAIATSDYGLDLVDAARDRLLQVVEQVPDHARALSSLSIIELTRGEFENGWKHYRHRHSESQAWADKIARMRKPRWNGENLDGKTILLLGEQGLGDNIHFIRYAAALHRAFDCQVWMVADPLRIGVLSTVEGIDRWLSDDQADEGYDFWTPLLDVPGLMGHNDPIDFPRSTPYLKAGTDRIAKWDPQLGPSEQMRVGVVWQGNPQHPLDHLRSFRLADLAPLGGVDHVTLVSLQHGVGSEQIGQCAGMTNLVCFDDRFDSGPHAFLDTASVIQRLDLVVTCDSAVAHLCGALGKPVWIALNHVADWRWGCSGNQSTWYPTATLFRKERDQGWESLFTTLAERLKSIDLSAWRRTYPLAKVPDRESALDGLIEQGRMALDDGEFRSAEEFCRKIIECEPACPDAYQLLGAARAGSEDWDGALSAISCAIAFERNPRYLADMASIYERRGDFERAIGWYEQAVEADALDAKSWDRLAELHLQRGNRQQSVRCQSRSSAGRVGSKHLSQQPVLPNGKGEARFGSSSIEWSPEGITDADQPLHADRSQRESSLGHHDGTTAHSIDCGEFNRLVRAKHGWFLYNRNDVYIGPSIARLGEYSEPEVEIFQQVLRPGDVVAEAGSNIGAHTVPIAAAVGPTGRVLAFEPQRLVYQTLCANVALNSLTQVETRWCALGERVDRLFVPQLDVRKENNFGGLCLESQSRGESVEMYPLDHFKIVSLRMLKADVEGMESAVLRGARETIQRCRPLMYVENDRADRAHELLQLMESFGYRIFWHRPRLYRPDNYFREGVNPFGNIASYNLLAIPRESSARIEGLEEVVVPARE